jgi:hypothetical protein
MHLTVSITKACDPKKENAEPQPTHVHCGKPECMVYGCFNTSLQKWISAKKVQFPGYRDQWLAGLIDGDGCFYINKTTLQISFEITVAVMISICCKYNK